jgi:hypothetical protein
VRRAYRFAEGAVPDVRGFGVAATLAQLGVLTDFTSAVAASAPPR